ncbi:Rpn family recombination-promoting nuclease/putative transposase [Anaerovoracaceae bacterium 41-7]|uniref:Rpn family recombination-promoting nuclease/putative transposase n=1 Tax=Senimuribacter intestinalis TaxID=2941507 RepID=UPI00203BE32D|nr:Rpn family recombination-promoting nuclease/putative transposase [Senimuribacter intestinalis]
MTKKKTPSALCNPVMFSTVMKDEELFRGLLARILPEKRVRRLHLHDYENEIQIFSAETILHTEHSIMINPYAKSVRFDVLFEDDDTWFDVECQAADTKELPQRSRYYHAVAAVDSLMRGQEYRELRPGYVIFICLFDLFGQDEPIYSFQMIDDKNHLHLDDGQVTIFLNSKCSKDDIPCQLKNLFQYLEEDTVPKSDSWLLRLQTAVKAMENEKEVRSRMTLYDEWVRTATAFEKCKQMLEESEKALQAVEAKRQQAEIEKKQAEVEKKQAETEKMQVEAEKKLMEYLLNENRIEDLKKALKDPVYKKQLFEELNN